MASKYTHRKYSIVSYDQKWKESFLNEAKILSSIFGNSAVAIEHIGSTAVPGLAGKPTIDILVLVDDFSIVSGLSKQMESKGYRDLGEYVMPGARLFIKEVDNTRLFNIHVFQKDHPHVAEMLGLRNYFISHPEQVKEYSQLKLDLVKRYPDDYGLYRKYKDEWMEELKQRVRAEGGFDKSLRSRT